MRILFSLSAFFLLLSPSFAERVAQPKGQSPRAIFDKDGNPMNPDEPNDPKVGWEILTNNKGENDQWKAVGALIPGGGKYACTLTLIEPPGGCALDPKRKAMAIASGHCVTTATAAGNVVRGQPYVQDVKFNFVKEPKGSSIPAQTETVLYASQKNIDISVFELPVTYEDLKEVKPKKIATSFRGEKLTNVGVPYVGIDAEDRFARKSECSSGGKASLAEGGNQWLESLRFKCSVVGGSSGSALFSPEGEIMGQMNTGTTRMDGRTLPCALNEPCELQGVSGSVDAAMNYGYDVTFLHKCADKQCRFDVSAQGCPLSTESGPELKNRENVNTLSEAFEVDPKKEFQAYKMKVGPAGTTNCAEESGYGEETTQQKITPNLTKDYPDGIYVICLRGKKNGQWQELKNATARTLRLDRKPPVAQIELRGSGYTVFMNDPDDRMTDFVYKFAKTASECRDKRLEKQYKKAIGISRLSLQPKAGDRFLCARAWDVAGNFQNLNEASIKEIP